MPLPDLSCDAPAAPGAMGEVGTLALDRRVCPLEPGWASFPWAFPMAAEQYMKLDGKNIKNQAGRAGWL